MAPPFDDEPGTARNALTIFEVPVGVIVYTEFFLQLRASSGHLSRRPVERTANTVVSLN